MQNRLIALAAAGTIVFGTSGAGSGTTALPGAAAGARARVAFEAPTKVAIPFTITVPSRIQGSRDRSLADIASVTRSATFTVASDSGLPTGDTTTVDCAPACAGSILAPLGNRTFIVKLFSESGGAGRMLAAATAVRTVRPQTAGIQLTFNPVVASVQLQLAQPTIAANLAGSKTQLLISARDPSGAVIVGPGSYVDRFGKALTIWIANSSPANTELSPTGFRKPLPSGTVSNVATIIYKGRAHFHYPTFTVATRGLPSLPKNGVTLVYTPVLDIDNQLDSIPTCFIDSRRGSFPSVGGFFYGAPYLALNKPRDPDCPLAADILRALPQQITPYQAVYDVNPKHDSIVKLGFGSDKKVYFAYSPTAANEQTVFGYLRRPTDRTAARISDVSPLGLGNDGQLWFTGSWNGRAMLGKLPPAGSSNWHPTLFSVPGADKVLSLEPGIGDHEAFLYHSGNGIFVGTVRTDLSDFRSVRFLKDSSGVGFGDLLAGADGTYLVGFNGGVYRITSNGGFGLVCSNVESVYRLADGSGIGFSTVPLQVGNKSFNAVVHVVAGAGCTAVATQQTSAAPFFDLLGVDSTTDDWILYSNPTGHRLGVF